MVLLSVNLLWISIGCWLCERKIAPRWTRFWMRWRGAHVLHNTVYEKWKCRNLPFAKQFWLLSFVDIFHFSRSLPFSFPHFLQFDFSFSQFWVFLLSFNSNFWLNFKLRKNTRLFSFFGILRLFVFFSVVVQCATKREFWNGCVSFGTSLTR